MTFSIPEALRYIFDQSPQPAVLISGQRVAYANPAAIELLGRNPIGMAFLDAVPRDCACNFFIHTKPGEVQLLHDQTFCGVRCHFCIIPISSGLLISLYSDQKTPSHAINGDVLNVVSDSCRDPINTIVAAADALERLVVPERSNEAAQYLRVVQKNCFEILSHILTISDLARECLSIPTNNDLTPCDFCAVVTTALSRLRPLLLERETEVAFTCYPDSLPIRANPQLLPRVLTGMLSHFSQFIARRKSILITLSKNQNFAQLLVTANGTSLPQPLLDLLAQPMLPNRKDILHRYGYPLFRARNVVELYTGTLSLQNTDTGTELCIKFPLAQDVTQLCTSFSSWLDFDFDF